MIIAVAMLATGCGFFDADGKPIVEAHRGAAGNWPQNSRAAVKGSVDRGYAALEIDLVVTKDGVAVLSHDPWIHETLCTKADGSKIGKKVFIENLTLAELRKDYLCGGVPDPAHPAAQVTAETVMTWDEVLDEVERDPTMQVHIDVKFEPGETPSAAVFAEKILGPYYDRKLPNDYYVSANLVEALKAFGDYGKTRGKTVPLSLAWPRFTPDTSDTAVALSAEAEHLFGLDDLVSLAEDSGVAALAIPYQVADRRAVEAARDNGLKIQIWTANTESLLSHYCTWPIDGLITDYPERAPCN